MFQKELRRGEGVGGVEQPMKAEIRTAEFLFQCGELTATLGSTLQAQRGNVYLL